MSCIAEIFSQGEEIVSGQTVDSNAAWLSQQLNDLGFSVCRHTAVGDDLDSLVGLIHDIAQRADCCICTGGLGPTSDDLTAEAVARAAGVDLIFDDAALRQIETWFAHRQRTMPAANRKQAYRPGGALRIDNLLGTAPGFALQINRCWFVFLPGVPSEMQAMFDTVKTLMLARFALQPANLVTLRSVGIGESAIQQRLVGLTLPEVVRLGFRAAIDEVQTKLLFPAGFPPADQQRLAETCRSAIGDYVFAIDGLDGQSGGDLLTVVDRTMPQSLKLALLETASGGLLAARCQHTRWLETVMVARHGAEAARQLAVVADSDPPRQLAGQLGSALRERGADWALVQLYDGSLDDYQSRDRVISLHAGLLTDTGFDFASLTLGGSAQAKQIQAAMLTLDRLRRRLFRLGTTA
ncbi:MAG: competence/damage-inducible protein A [Methylomonas sp.]|nr:competence/damage-inducible protein A [Methylomonas sp.]PPD22888.1 MAG: competence/damage-inducible protein A [Methylomonas sp.]PPD27390.1 MAG: competence/damage-inducible protein A [Methylomonas sp.]PPD39366.1 MAG: competence/damage-inducible protein A [Methylomonas sp.]PPD41989.1 MAG: competence/damage-inducible protein A [Methylomonas sp.]